MAIQHIEKGGGRFEKGRGKGKREENEGISAWHSFCLSQVKGLAYHSFLVLPAVSFFCHLRNMNDIISIYTFLCWQKLRTRYFVV